MKRLTLILSIIALISLTVIPSVMAYTEPSQGTDNATDVIIWHGDALSAILQGSIYVTSNTTAEVSITSANITIANLEDGMTVAGEASAQVIADEYESIWTELLLFLLLIAIMALAFWQKNAFLYLLAVPVGVVYGLSLAAGATVYSSQWVIGVVIAIIGLFCLFRVVVNEILPRMTRGKG